MLIKNANVLTMEGRDFPNGYILISNGIIKEVGDMAAAPNCAQVYDAGGLFAVPGFVDAHSHLGMWEDAAAFEGDDGNEATDPVTPHLRAIDAINPNDRCFEEALFAGVTAAVVGPGSANPIGGTFAALKTYGRRVDDMLINPCVAMKFAFGENPKSVYNAKKKTPMTRMGTAALIREYLKKTKEYIAGRGGFEGGSQVGFEGGSRVGFEGGARANFDFKLEALAPLFLEKLPVKAHAHRADDIFTALRIAREFGLEITIEHCTEGHLIADYLAREGVGVCVGPALTDRSKPELKNLSFETAGALDKAGLCVAIVSDHPVTPEKHLSLCAAMAVKEGMDKSAALRAITINAAKLCKIDDRIGSIRSGKDADIVLFDRHPIDFYSKPAGILAGGEWKKTP